jgi:mannose-6-phosphate isomerase
VKAPNYEGSEKAMIEPFQLTPEYRDYVWGGNRLRSGQRTAEAWVVYEGDQISDGPFKGYTLSEAAAEFGPELLGQAVVDKTGLRFPLLVKLLDCADWLSLQVHPNDEQARRLEGPDQFGKTEAWYVLDAAAGAELLFGLKPGTSPAALQNAVRGNNVLQMVQRHKVQQGDTVFIAPGMIHALGPGLLIYEVQQTSNITYRVFDWNRPAASGRIMHIEQSLAVLNPQAEARIRQRPRFIDGSRSTLVTCPYFTLALLCAYTNPVPLDTRGDSFHSITVIEGRAVVQGSGWSISLGRYETVIIPAVTGEYWVVPKGNMMALKSSAIG